MCVQAGDERELFRDIFPSVSAKAVDRASEKPKALNCASLQTHPRPRLDSHRTCADHRRKTGVRTPKEAPGEETRTKRCRRLGKSEARHLPTRPSSPSVSFYGCKLSQFPSQASDGAICTNTSN